MRNLINALVQSEFKNKAGALVLTSLSLPAFLFSNLSGLIYLAVILSASEAFSKN